MINGCDYDSVDLTDESCCFNTQGPQGSIGYQGKSGVRGFQGDIGFQSETVIIGAQGDIGAQGACGFGSQGPTGLWGVDGNRGIQGDRGPQGLSQVGAQGFVNGNGSQGPDGQNDIGMQGPQGSPLTGFEGATGLSGFQGVQYVGAQGLPGIPNIGVIYQHVTSATVSVAQTPVTLASVTLPSAGTYAVYVNGTVTIGTTLFPRTVVVFINGNSVGQHASRVSSSQFSDQFPINLQTIVTVASASSVPISCQAVSGSFSSQLIADVYSLVF